MTIDEWIENTIHRSGGFIDFENHEWPIYHKSREYSLAAFVIRALSNPLCAGSGEVLEAIKARRDSLTKLPLPEQAVLS